VIHPLDFVWREVLRSHRFFGLSQLSVYRLEVSLCCVSAMLRIRKATGPTVISDRCPCPSIPDLNLLGFLLMQLNERDEFRLVRHELDVFVLELFEGRLRASSDLLHP